MTPRWIRSAPKRLTRTGQEYRPHPWNLWLAAQRWFTAHYGMTARGRGCLTLRVGRHTADFYVGEERDQGGYPTEKPPWTRTLRAIERRLAVRVIRVRLPNRTWSPGRPCPCTFYPVPPTWEVPPPAHKEQEP